MDFKFYPLRFEFTAKESLFFPPGKASNILRGALGVIFRSIVCVPECRRSGDSRTCDIRNSCPYAKVFEPISTGGPSGLADPPRPFVFRARHLDGHTIQPNQTFYFDLNVFSLELETLSYFIQTFAALAREGLGPNRGKAELQRVRRLGTNNGTSEQLVYCSANEMMAGHIDPVTLSLEPAPTPIAKVHIEFLTPTELKHGQEIMGRPEFSILFGRIRDRICTLRALYGEGPIQMDFPASNARTARVRMSDCQMTRQEFGRRSSRTGQAHSIGGFIGTADYEGDLAEFLPWLDAARYTGVGRQAVWGKGEILIGSMN